METDLPAIFAKNRLELGLTQAQLASKLNVQQQMIARWEKGTSTPSTRHISQLEKIFSKPPGKWVEMAKAKTLAGNVVDSGPARPLHGSLPLSTLSPHDFERLTLALAQAHFSKGTFHLAGGNGHKQYGADVEGDEPEQGKILFQCKREARFGVGKLRQAVEKAKQAEAQVRILVLSQTASPDLRREAEVLGWEIWDHDDIVNFLQQRLSHIAAQRIVWTFFPGYREHFLGSRNSGPWIAPNEYFDGHLNRDNGTFSHRWGLVGRETQLEELLDWSRAEQGFAVLLGPAGIGKTRLLLEMTSQLDKENTSWTILFVDPTSEVQREDFEQLGDSEVILIVDDAHGRSDLETIFRVALARQSRAKTHVLLATRPHGKSLLLQDLAQIAGLLKTPLITLGALSDSDALTLAANVLKINHDSVHLKRLVVATKDCTLLLVAACVLLRTEQISLAHLGNAEAFRAVLLEKMYDDYAQSCGALPGSLIAQDVLRFLAAVQPFNLLDPEALKSAAGILGNASQEDLLAALNKVLATGVVIKRGPSLTIQPDLLADHILVSACFNTSLGVSTKFHETIWNAASTELKHNLIVNLSKVDWHLSALGTAPGSLLDNVWHFFESNFASSGIYKRIKLLNLLQKVAYYQPRRALSLVQWTLDNKIDGTESFMGSSFDYQKVYAAATPVLHNCSFTQDSLEQAADLLWDLSHKVLAAPSHANPGHPIRVLTELASYSQFKPAHFTEIIINRSLGWFSDEPTIAAIDILEEALSWEVRDTFFEGNTMNITATSPLKVLSPEDFQRLRRKVLNTFLENIGVQDLGIALRIVASFSKSIRGPVGLMGREAIPEETKIHNEELEWLLGEIVGSNHLSSLDPLILCEIENLVSSLISSKSKTTASLAQQALAALPETLDRDLSNALKHGLWGYRPLYQKRERSVEESKRLIADLVRKLLEQAPNTCEVLRRIERRLSAFRDSSGQADCSPSYLIETLVEQSPSAGTSIVERVLSEPTSPFRHAIGAVLATLRKNQTNRSSSLKLSLKLLQLNDEGIACEIASSFGIGWGATADASNEELELIHRLASDERNALAYHLISFLRQAAGNNPQMVIKVLLEMRIGRSARLTDRALSLFSENEPLKIEMLDDEAISSICGQLTTCDSIGEYWVGEFLSGLGQKYLPMIIELLKKRVEHAETGKASKDFQPLPYRWDDNSPISTAGVSMRRILLDDMRIWSSEDVEGWIRGFNGPRLFAALAGDFDDEVLASIGKGLEAEIPQAKRVARLLLEAPDNFVWSKSKWVSEMLETASRRGKELYETLCASLHNAATSGIRHGTPGQPFPEDLELRKQAQGMVESLVPGSAAERFYRSLQTSAEHSIARADEEYWG